MSVTRRTTLSCPGLTRSAARQVGAAAATITGCADPGDGQPDVHGYARVDTESR